MSVKDRKVLDFGAASCGRDIPRRGILPGSTDVSETTACMRERLSPREQIKTIQIFQELDRIKNAFGYPVERARELVEAALTEDHNPSEVSQALIDVTRWVSGERRGSELESMVRETFEGKIENATCRPIL